MKRPITREQLLAFDPVKDKEEEDNIELTKHIKYLINAMITELHTFMRHKPPHITSFQINDVEHMRRIIRRQCYIPEHLHKKEVYYPRFLEELHNQFIDCHISLDDKLIISWE